LGNIIRTAWDRFQIIGKANGDYVSRFITFLMYCTVLVPFALIARYFVDPLEMNKSVKPHWRARKPVGTTLEEARNQS